MITINSILISTTDTQSRAQAQQQGAEEKFHYKNWQTENLIFTHNVPSLISAHATSRKVSAEKGIEGDEAKKNSSVKIFSAASDTFFHSHEHNFIRRVVCLQAIYSRRQRATTSWQSTLRSLSPVESQPCKVIIG